MTHLVLILLAWLGLAPLDPGPALIHDDLRPAWDHSESVSEADDGDLGPALDPGG